MFINNLPFFGKLLITLTAALNFSSVVIFYYFELDIIFNINISIETFEQRKLTMTYRLSQYFGESNTRRQQIDVIKILKRSLL